MSIAQHNKPSHKRLTKGDFSWHRYIKYQVLFAQHQNEERLFACLNMSQHQVKLVLLSSHLCQKYNCQISVLLTDFTI